ncbi:alpha/beta hydrolase domain-containing protein [Aquincola sp. MAHUQ-54]|uniref:Alpha/beta hydrolase domain-containing protein n=1 Tax=Aquincola agrisoli TaxID=3119538 RepID=A0AAW9Q4Y8_9BURK
MSRNSVSRISRTLVATALAVAFAGAAQAQVASSHSAPKVIGPVQVNATPGAGLTKDYPHFGAEPNFDLTASGYVEEEFFLEGQATRYETPSMQNAVAVSNGHPYKTRILVRKPSDPAKFNGVVIVEWDNVTSGYGIDLHWQYSREYLTRAGYIHVGVQAQRVGVHNAPNGLKAWSPTRYGDLDVTAGGTVMDDSLSYDIFTQVARALKGPGKQELLGSMKPRAVLAVGQSQSAGRLTSYYNSVQPLHKAYDGFLVQVAGGPFRTDVKEPMIRVLSESEVNRSRVLARQPDSPTYRGWEVAGASHVDYWWVMFRHGMAVRDGMPPPNLACQPEPASHVPLRFVLNAGYHHLAKWVLDKVQPPSATPIQVASMDPFAIARDGHQIAQGGIRMAEVDVPTATNRGDQVGMSPGCPGNYGMHVPFGAQKLAQLYPSKASYVQAVEASVQRNVQQGFVLPQDGEEIVRRARNSPVGTGRPVPIH